MDALVSPIKSMSEEANMKLNRIQEISCTFFDPLEVKAVLIHHVRLLRFDNLSLPTLLKPRVMEVCLA